MNHRHPPGIAVNADTAEQSGDAGAYILAHNDGQGHTVGDAPCEGQGLENTH